MYFGRHHVFCEAFVPQLLYNEWGQVIYKDLARGLVLKAGHEQIYDQAYRLIIKGVAFVKGVRLAFNYLKSAFIYGHKYGHEVSYLKVRGLSVLIVITFSIIADGSTRVIVLR